MNTHEVRLSVVVVPVGGPQFVRRCLTALCQQMPGAIEEIIVPQAADDIDYARLAADFPAVSFVPVTYGTVRPRRWQYARQHDTYDMLKTQGMSACRGSVIALIEDTVIPERDWAVQVRAAHQLPHAVIGGAVEYAGRGLLGWAIYFMDFGRYARPLAEGPQSNLTDINVAYKAATLAANRDLWSHRYHETELHTGLAQRGATLWLRPQIVVRQDRRRLVFSEAMRERFQWGWVYGAKRATMVRRSTRAALILLSPAIPLVRLARLARKALTNKQLGGRFISALLYLLPLTLAWSCGELYGYLNPAKGGLETQKRPQPGPSARNTAEQREEQASHGVH